MAVLRGQPLRAFGTDAPCEAKATAAGRAATGRASPRLAARWRRHAATVVATAARRRTEPRRIRRAIARALGMDVGDARAGRDVRVRHVARREHARDHRADDHARHDAEERRVIAGVRAVARGLELAGVLGGGLALDREDLLALVDGAVRVLVEEAGDELRLVLLVLDGDRDHLVAFIDLVDPLLEV